MKIKILTILSGDFEASHFIRIGENHKINLYVGKDEYGKYSFDFRVAIVKNMHRFKVCKI